MAGARHDPENDEEVLEHAILGINISDDMPSAAPCTNDNSAGPLPVCPNHKEVRG